jgi:hypothetical protein
MVIVLMYELCTLTTTLHGKPNTQPMTTRGVFYLCLCEVSICLVLEAKEAVIVVKMISLPQTQPHPKYRRR